LTLVNDFVGQAKERRDRAFSCASFLIQERS